MANTFFDNLFTDAGMSLASAVTQARRKLRDAFSLSRYFNAATQHCLQQAAQLAYDNGKLAVDTEHALHAVLGSEIVQSILERCGVSAGDVRGFVEKNYLGVIAVPKGSFEEMTVSMNLRKVIESAYASSKDLGHTYIGPEHLIIALTTEEAGTAREALSKFGLETQELRRQTIELVGRGPTRSGSSTPKLDRFSRDLTRLAQRGKLDPVIGRQKEIDTTIEILARRKKNNAVLIGDPGVGKTAIVEGLAQRIIGEMVPEVLRNRRIVELNLNSLVAGAQYRGQFEERIKAILDEVLRSSDEVILFIDELHTIVGAGSSAEGTLDAANIIKPALARGELHVIGATTLNEYKKHVEKDAALERRFQPVFVPEPSVDEAIAILSGLRPSFEHHHKVAITQKAISAAAELSKRYIVNRFLPDKAIDLLDQAAAKVRIKERKGVPEVTHLDVADVLAALTGIPVAELSSAERDKLLNFEIALGQRVFGQDMAIARVSDAVRMARSGLKNQQKPLASFFFFGPAGVGKTEMARALAVQLFGSDDSIVQIDMSQFSEAHSISRLIGAPPGYIGYDEGGQLTERVRQRPYSVVVLDQIDKAHRDAHNIIMQILDTGRITDSRGRLIDFSNSILILTTTIPESAMSFSPGASYEQSVADALDLLSRHFGPEFLNRVDDVVLFKPLGRKELRAIAQLALEQIRISAAGAGVAVSFEDSVVEHLIDTEGGARGLQRRIRHEVEAALAKAIIRETGSDIRLNVSYNPETQFMQVE